MDVERREVVKVDQSAFTTLLHAHDHIWAAKDWPLAIRAKACAHIMVLMAEILK
jgi:hypothetical protein